jgi:hypothetical protein
MRDDPFIGIDLAWQSDVNQSVQVAALFFFEVVLTCEEISV